MTPLVSVKSLVKFFPVRGSSDTVKAVSDVSFEIPRGKTLGLIGESGSGKSTVGRCLLGLIKPTRGEIFFDGQVISAFDRVGFQPFRKHLQMVFQDPLDSLNPRMTALSSILDPLRMMSALSESEKIHRARDIANKVELTDDDLALFPHQMSGGQQQRVGIARAIVTRPDFIVLDEPTTALDISIRGRITDLLINLQDEMGLSYLYISHDLGTVEYICHYVAIMYLGKIVESGPKNEVFNAPQHPYSKALLSSVLHPDPDYRRTKYELEGEIPSPINLPTGCALHPRCPEVIAECRTWSPTPIKVSMQHEAACLHIREFERQRTSVSAEQVTVASEGN